MTSPFGLGRIAEFFEPCILFDYEPGQVTWSTFFLLFDLWPFAVTGGFWIITGLMSELFFWFIALAATLDWLVNWGLQYVVGPSDNIQPVVCPISGKQMPAFASEFVILMWTMLFGLAMLLYPKALPGGFVSAMMVVSQIAVYARIYLLFSTPSQLIAGAAIGFAEALVYIALIALMRHYGVDRMLIAAPRVLLMYRFSDTIMYPSEPTLIAARRPNRVMIKVYPDEDLLDDDEIEPSITTEEEPQDANAATRRRHRLMHLYTADRVAEDA